MPNVLDSTGLIVARAFVVRAVVAARDTDAAPRAVDVVATGDALRAVAERKTVAVRDCSPPVAPREEFMPLRPAASSPRDIAPSSWDVRVPPVAVPVRWATNDVEVVADVVADDVRETRSSLRTAASAKPMPNRHSVARTGQIRFIPFVFC